MTALLTENIELLSLAPDGAKRLRALVLDLAVRGLLTQPQDGDGRSDDLLAQILRDREGLVAAGDLKFKALPALKYGEAPFQLPAHWLWTRLGEITNYGATTKADSIPDDAWLLDLEDIEKDTSRLLKRVRFIERGSLSDKNAFRTGDVLYCKLRPYLNKVIVADHDGYCTTEILPVRCHGSWVPRYFQLALKSPEFLAYVNGKSYGMKMPRLGTEDGRMAVFPLPPLAEQHRIVAKVDELMALCDRLEARQQDAEAAHAKLVQVLLDRLAQARGAAEFRASWQRLAGQFHSMFTTNESLDRLKESLLDLAVSGRLAAQSPADVPAAVTLNDISSVKARLVEEDGLRTTAREDVPSEEHYLPLPVGWAYARIGNLARFIDYRGRTPVKTGSGVPLITAKNVRPGYIDREPREYIAAEEFDAWMTRGIPQVGDMLFTTEAPLGNIALIDIDERFALAQRVICFQLHHLELGPYMRIALMSRTVQTQIAEMATGMTATGVKASRLKELPLPIPPLAEQRRIVTKVDELLTLLDQLKARMAAARTKHVQLAEVLVEQAVA